MQELNDLYDYGLKIYQNTDYFKFSLDSILLGEFIKLRANDKILDICTGNAPIPMILSTKRSDISIDAVEIQKGIYDLALKSIRLNELENIIKLHNQDANKIKFTNKFDIVLANPPYFKVTEKSQKNDNVVKRIARHEVNLTLESVIRIAKNNLNENGTFYMVHRVERYLDTINLLQENKFGIRKTVFVYTKKNTPAEFFLIEASRCKKSDMKVTSLYVENLNTYKGIFEEEKR